MLNCGSKAQRKALRPHQNPIIEDKEEEAPTRSPHVSQKKYAHAAQKTTPNSKTTSAISREMPTTPEN